MSGKLCRDQEFEFNALIIAQYSEMMIPFAGCIDTGNEDIDEITLQKMGKPEDSETSLELNIGSRDENFLRDNEKLSKEIMKSSGNDAGQILNEERFGRLIENIEFCIWQVNDRGLYTYVSPVSNLIIGYSPDELVNRKHIYDFFSPDHKQGLKEEIFKNFNNKESFSNFENSNIHKHGHHVILETNAHPILDKKGNLKGYYGTFKDITGQKFAETELKQAIEKANEGEELKTIFLRNFSHEIRTPLNAIVGFSSFLAEPGLSNDKIKTYVDIIQQNSQHLLSMISDIMSMSAIEAGQNTYHEKETNILTILKNLLNPLKSGNISQEIDFRYIVGITENEARILTDEGKLVKILTYLLDNALKFTKKGIIELGCSIEGDLIQFYCKDTGIGIPAEFHTKIYERFSQIDNTSTRKYGGNGIGLTLAKSYIEQLGGKLWLESEQGKGSVFYFTIPYRKAIKPGVKTKTRFKTEREPEKNTILVVEDDELNFYLVNEILSLHGYEIIHAWNGLEALELIEQTPAIDLVLMDIKMPVMNGYEATREIKALRPDLPIIAQSAFTRYNDQDKGLKAGFDDYITKPILKDDLLFIIFKHLKYKP